DYYCAVWDNSQYSYIF
nr:immunoglobulin light chain junction region [Macaca mulatta]MOW57394.1 immunoglobulin light chain junction region [Macaca mulatta]MOW58246.1 immunoglobulin light chain junction region [Macaca mulatta]MOW58275.1 immunoglobulin light chain junction region [Macaca mulatta]MOW59127.1 immunoglobulin light chain junction region [Macaca mulatta]